MSLLNFIDRYFGKDLERRLGKSDWEREEDLRRERSAEAVVVAMIFVIGAMGFFGYLDPLFTEAARVVSGVAG